MNLNDLIIIYLALGAPFAVYYFLQNRNSNERKSLYLKTLLGFVFWIPFAAALFARNRLLTKIYNLEFGGRADSDAAREAEIHALQKQLEALLRSSGDDGRFSVYEFREVFDRYTGLTLEAQNVSDEAASSEREIFRIAPHENKKLGEICLHRRNRRRLLQHQTEARRDFLKMLAAADADRQKLFAAAARLFFVLPDSEANNSLSQLSNQARQTEKDSAVSHLEKEIWNAEKLKPSPASQISTNFPVLTATAKLSGKD